MSELDDLCPHGRIKTAFCHPCEMEKILDLESDYGVVEVDDIVGNNAYIDGQIQPKAEGTRFVVKDKEPIKIANCVHGVRIDRHCSVCDGGFPGRASETQVAGDHYCTMAIQPAIYIHRNNIDYLRGRAINYLSRQKHDEEEDVRKAIHMLELWLEERRDASLRVQNELNARSVTKRELSG
jgi:hypothetical protein